MNISPTLSLLIMTISLTPPPRRSPILPETVITVCPRLYHTIWAVESGRDLKQELLLRDLTIHAFVASIPPVVWISEIDVLNYAAATTTTSIHSSGCSPARYRGIMY